MCGIVGVSLDFITSSQLELVERVLIESQIRGMHASGIVWHDGYALQREAEPKPIGQMLKDNPSLVDQAVTKEQHLNLIAHIRYSTSDLAFNQPIADTDLAIAHNGIVSQTLPSSWESEFDLKVSTRNDSELILRALQNDEDPLEKFPDASIAYVSINKYGDVGYSRNGKRPLWVTTFRNGFIITSTKDIMLRASNDAFIPMPVLSAGPGEELQ
jgi:glutamine phosphoribosylpyrophosphate amidotransferase